MSTNPGDTPEPVEPAEPLHGESELGESASGEPEPREPGPPEPEPGSAEPAGNLGVRYTRAHDSQHKPRTPAEAKYAQRNAEAAAEGNIGFGAHRYAEDPEDVPPAGSEESWSAEPHPGFETDPVLRKRYSSRRVAITALAGVVVLAFGFWMGAKNLASKSPNGNGSAPWTAAPRVDGAVVGGINAQNNIGDAAYNNGAATAIVRDAAVECADPVNDPGALIAGTGQAINLTGWGSAAGPTLNAIQQEAQSLNTAVEAQDIPKLAAATKAMCGAMIAARTLPPVNDPAAASAFKSAMESWAAAVGDALQGAQGSMFQYNAATAELANAQTALAALNSLLHSPS
jgi:hypothetical protein